MKKYQPSNGTEGMDFIDFHCMNCINCDPNPDGKTQCDILCRTMAHDINDKEYPTEWCYVDGKPTCTAWVKWDWDEDGDPNDPDNPKAPTPEDPNQLCFPWMLDEIIGEPVKKLETVC